MVESRRYAIVLLAALGVTALAICAVNVLVDPYDLFKVMRITGLNVEKPAIRTRRLFVPLDLAGKQADVLVLGSSRGRAAYEAVRRRWPRLAVRNAGISALRAREAAEFLTLYAERDDTRHIVYLPDFFGFNRNVPFDTGYIPTIVSEGRLWRLRMMAVFSVSTLSDSLRTVLENVRAAGAHGGGGALAATRERARAQAPEPDRLRKAFAYQLRAYMTNPRFYRNYVLDRAAFSALARAFRKVRARGKRLTVIIGPSHALQWEAIARSGLWEAFEAWKRQMARLGREVGVTVWDFASYSEISTVRIEQAAAYYEDSSHYSPKTARMMLSCVFDGAGCARLDGAPLVWRALEDRLAAVRARRAAWRRRHAGGAMFDLLPSLGHSVGMQSRGGR